jgi:hypothetical protein
MENRKFEVTSGKMVLSDPCYELGTWCQGVAENVKNGTWVGVLEQSDEGAWGVRNSILISMNVEAMKKNPLLERELMSSGDLINWGGVDSGQFGHFDFANYRKDENAIDVPKVWEDEWESQEGDKFYRACCYQTLETEDSFGVVPFGVLSSSGYGDGSYPTYGIKDENGEWVGFMTIFIGDDEDEDDEWEDEEEFEEEEDEN